MDKEGIGGDHGAVVRTVMLCFLAATFEGIDLQSMAIAAHQLIPELHLTPAQFGTAASISLAGLLIGAVAGGRISDRVGRKAVLIASLALLGLFSLVTTLVQDYAALLVVRLVVGLGMGGAFPTLIALVSDVVSGPRKTLPLSLVYSGNPMGTIIGTLMVLWLGAAFEWRWIFYLGGLGPLLLLPALGAWLPDDRPAAASAGRVRLMPVRDVLFADGRALPTILLWTAFFCTLLVIYLLTNWVNQMMTGRGFTSVQATMVLLGFGVGSLVGSIALGVVLDAGYRRFTAIFAYAGVALSLIGLALSGDYRLLVLCGVGCGFFAVGAQLVNYALAPGYYPVEIRGTGVGWSVAIGRIGSILGPLLGGLLLGVGMPASTVLLLFVPALAIAAIASTVMLWGRPATAAPRSLGDTIAALPEAA